MKNLWAVPFIITFMCSCGASSNETEQNNVAGDTSVVEISSSQTSADQPNEKLLKITAVEDGGYPFFILSTKTSDGSSLELEVNLEDLGLSPDELYKMSGKTARISYTSEKEDAVMDIVLDGKTLLGEYGGQQLPQWKKVEGVLSAPEESQGDLPGTIEVTPTGGATRQFDFYITEEVVQAHGKSVVVYIEPRTVSVARSIRLE